MSGGEAVPGAAAPEGHPEQRPYDEAFEAGEPRPEYAALLGALEGVALGELRAAVGAHVDARDVAFGGGPERTPFVVDPVPRVIEAAEWATLEAGLAQRMRALNAFIVDVYSEREIVAAGRIPERVVRSCDHYEPEVRGTHAPGIAPAAVAGLDVIRDCDGRFKVLEDNVRTPSGMAYASAARGALDAHLPIAAPERRRSMDAGFDALAAALRHAAGGEGAVALLSDGPTNSAWYEHEAIAHRLGIPIVTRDDLVVRGDHLHAWLGGAARPLDVLYRRTDEDRLSDDAGRPTSLARLLSPSLEAGRLRCVNEFGTGVADDKLVHAYVEEMVRFYLAEEPLIESVPTHDLGTPGVLEDVLERLEEIVIKPRTGHGGRGVVICAHASDEDRARAARSVAARPERFVAQETVSLSTHPTVVDGRLAPRHVDLRAFVVTAGDTVSVIPGGLTRVAFDPGSLVVNSSQRGGGKDTWVLA